MKTDDFRRVLGPWSAAALIAGSMIGTGIFFFVSDVAKGLPGSGWIIAAWLAGGVIASFGALSLAELAAAYPETGGIYVFLRRAYGPLTGFLYSWAKFLIMRPASFAILAVAFAGFCTDFIGGETTAPVKQIIAIGVIVVLTGINAVGVRAGAGVQNVLTIIKILALLAIICVGAVYATGVMEEHTVEIETSNGAAGSGDSLLWLFGAALIPVMWTFGGWDESPFVAEEVRNPERNLPLSILGGVWIVALLYVAVNAAYLAVLTPAELANSSGQTATLAMERAIGPGARKVLDIALMISTFGAANGLALTGSRIAYATGREQALFRWFARTNSRTRTPVRGLIAQAALTVAAILVLSNPFQLLLYTGLAYWTFAGLTAAAVIILRKSAPERERPFRVWCYPVIPVLFIAASIAMAVSVIVKDWRNGVATGVIAAAGLVAYGAQRYIFDKDRSQGAAG